ncbi:MAG: YraN family protein [Acidimicrobiia bacterium]|nr:YraN family protein [Acidimicrobiia bacterium]
MRPKAPPSGPLGESIAERFLVSRGCDVVARNVRADGGEIDLLIKDQGRIAAVEVKTTSDGSDPIEAVDERKMSLIARTVASLDRRIDRIDVVTVVISLTGVQIRWLRGVD